MPASTAELWAPLPRAFYQRHPVDVAPELLNKILVRDDGRAARIVEVEAYAGSGDPAAHSYRGRTARTATMFGPAGHLYVYFTYGMHWGSNAVCGPEGEGWGVLLRAAEPLAGIEAMRAARPAARRDRDLASGPGRLSQAFGITRALDGADIVTRDRGIGIVSDGVPPPTAPAVGPRVGISRATEFPWRWHVPEHPHVSARGSRARR
ncbi:3-methyladenine DNA glycosylase [Pseudoxanthomonas jiangsuensis]|uniref:DNA-3-methyladenine glycosylase n=1 Tax=Pseudoxanthomonas jiangsuensis TaxID=619688 RepID=UPI001391D0EA|nr:DNA-3-methyladenine glycosylase [Pseudoxanthomonas jiangsuensis]KAF1698001.1 3-methyladenine DNA glycosylase [Pseudoxanthomonas jiangsuensis]